MKKHIFTMIIILLLSGCAGRELSLRHDVALSFDSERIAYDASGKGKTALIFIHGWSCDGRYWQKQIPEFSKDYRVINVDLAGHGHSSLNRSEYSMLSFAKDVKAIIEKEKIDRAVLIGHSMGGGIIAEAARIMPKKVIAIIGIDTSQNVGEKYPQAVIDKMINPFQNDFTNAAKKFVVSMFPKESDLKLVNWVKEDMSSAPKESALSSFRCYLEQYVTGEASAVFKDIKIPVIFINSKFWPTAEKENRKYIKNYKVFYIEKTGHFPMLERPYEFNRILRNALNSMESN